MKIEDLNFGENALLSIDLLRKLVMKVEQPAINYDGSVEELVMMLDIAAHSSSKELVKCAQQLLRFSDSLQIAFFWSVGVKLEHIFAAKSPVDTRNDNEDEAVSVNSTLITN